MVSNIIPNIQYQMESGYTGEGVCTKKNSSVSDTIINKIQRLKEERNAIILAHNYQIDEVQDIADYVGDSLGLSKKAAESDADTIVFCGVHFMAETASILCPEKRVLMPDINAGCPMANMITRKGLMELKKKHHGAIVVGYINTGADVKTEIDICCTSTNAVRIINSLGKSKIIFVPDKYLAHYISTITGRKLISWDGFCPTHVKILPEDIQKQKIYHPEAKVIVHPECIPGVIKLSDETLSTDGMCRYARKSNVSEMIIGTEIGLLHRLRKENPKKRFYPASDLAVCPNMKRTTVEKIMWSLEDMKFEVKVPDDIRIKARESVNRMLEIV